MRKKKIKKIIKKYFKKSDIPKNDLSIYKNQFYITYMLFFSLLVAGTKGRLPIRCY